MKSNGSSKSNSNDTYTKIGEKYVELLWDKLQGEPDKEGETLVPKDFEKLKRYSDHPSYKDYEKWIRCADLFLLPFHSFNDTSNLTVQIDKSLSDTIISTFWQVAYSDYKAGTAPFYEAELLICKKKIYEQGQNLREIIEINSETDIKPFADKSKIADFSDKFMSSLSATCKTKIELINTENQSKTTLPTLFFNRFRDKSSSMKKDKNGISNEVWQVRLSDYWLDWAEAAHRASFDFDYLFSLQPLEMRLYELIQLLRFKNGRNPSNKRISSFLEISYDEIVRLMPLTKLKKLEEIENQINLLCDNHLKNGYLKSISIKLNKRNEDYMNPQLKLQF